MGSQSVKRLHNEQLSSRARVCCMASMEQVCTKDQSFRTEARSPSGNLIGYLVDCLVQLCVYQVDSPVASSVDSY